MHFVITVEFDRPVGSKSKYKGFGYIIDAQTEALAKEEGIRRCEEHCEKPYSRLRGATNYRVTESRLF